MVLGFFLLYKNIIQFTSCPTFCYFELLSKSPQTRLFANAWDGCGPCEALRGQFGMIEISTWTPQNASTHNTNINMRTQ